MDIQLLYSNNDFTKISRENYVDFLFESLGKYGDPKEDIDRSINYAFSKESGKGGFLVAAFEDDKIIGGVVMNKTGMSGYIPDYLLVYVAVDPSTRGKGYGKQIIDKALENADGDVALHVDMDNPAQRLYKRLGFDIKYYEMRYKK